MARSPSRQRVRERELKLEREREPSAQIRNLRLLRTLSVHSPLSTYPLILFKQPVTVRRHP